jgi:acyl-CoA synthetase (AMP-forming)/AMP-acid ligase II
MFTSPLITRWGIFDGYSGSSGMPKGVVLTHYNICIGVVIVSEYLMITDKDIILGILPFSFDYGLNQIMSAFYSSATLVIKYPFLFHELPALINVENITGLAGMPTI